MDLRQKVTIYFGKTRLDFDLKIKEIQGKKSHFSFLGPFKDNFWKTFEQHFSQGENNIHNLVFSAVG